MHLSEGGTGAEFHGVAKILYFLQILFKTLFTVLTPGVWIALICLFLQKDQPEESCESVLHELTHLHAILTKHNKHYISWKQCMYCSSV